MKTFIYQIAVVVAMLLTATNLRAQNAGEWTNVDYVGDGVVGHMMDIRLPDNKSTGHKVVVLIYGSAWFSNNSKKDAFRELGQPLLDAGFAVVSINHRASMEAKFPAQVNDVKAAIRYLRANAKSYNLDTSFIGITGYSSGGHLSSFIGATNGVGTFSVGKDTVDIEGSIGSCQKYSSSVNAVVDWFGPIDMSRMKDCATTNDGRSPEAVLLGCAPGDNPDLVALLNPMTYIDKNDPMFLVIHGDSDPVVPYCQSVFFSEALKDKGRLADFISVKGGNHGPVTINPQTLQRMTTFFRQEAHLAK